MAPLLLCQKGGGPMDTPISRAEHEEFSRRLEEENQRQNRRIQLLEDSVLKRWKDGTAKCGARLQDMSLLPLLVS